jgi:hypothetical protein
LTLTTAKGHDQLTFSEKRKGGDMTRVEPSIFDAAGTNKQDPHQQLLSSTPIDRILERLSALELPSKEHLKRYMRHKNLRVRLAILRLLLDQTLP